MTLTYISPSLFPLHFHSPKSKSKENRVIKISLHRVKETEMSYGGFTLPKGFRFHPSDDELLSHYLQKKNQRVDPLVTAIIPEIDVSKHEPRDLPALVLARGGFLDREWFTVPDSADMDWYFFSPRVFKHSSNSSKGKSKSTKIDRTTKEGSWKKQGDTRRIKGSGSDEQYIGGRRILTFYFPKKKKTDWVIHEYYLTKAGSDEQIGDFVLCRLKDNHFRKKSGKSDHNRQDGTLCNEEQGSNEPGNVAIVYNGKDCEAEDHGGSCRMALKVEASASKQQENVLPLPYGNDDDPENGDGSCHDASCMLTPAEECQVFGELKDAVFTNKDALIGFDGNDQQLKGYTSGPVYADDRDPWVCNGQPDSYSSSESEMAEKVLHKPGALAFPDTFPMTPLQSSIYTKLDTKNSLNDENRKRKYPFADSDLFVTKKNHTDGVRSTPSSDSENQAANMISEGYQPGGDLGSDLPSSQELLSRNQEPRDLSHDNDNIGWDDLPPITDDFDFALVNFSDPFTDGSFSDENNESSNALVNGCSPLAIGATLQCS